MLGFWYLLWTTKSKIDLTLCLYYVLAVICSLLYFGAIRPEEINLCSKINLSILVSEGNMTGALEEVSSHVHESVGMTSGSHKSSVSQTALASASLYMLKNYWESQRLFFTWVITTDISYIRNLSWEFF